MAARWQRGGSAVAARWQHGGSTVVARWQHGGSTAAAKCPSQEVDFRAKLIHMNIFNANEI